MKKIFKFAIFAICALIFAACGKETPFAPSDGEGVLSTKRMIVTIENEENVVRSSIDVANFLVDICKGDEIVEHYVFSEMPEVITLPVGQYTVKVRSGELQPVAWDEPYFVGTQDFTVEQKKITEVETVVCKLANVRVSVLFNSDLLAMMSDDSKVTVEMGNTGTTIDFAKNETRSAYFAYVEGSNTLVATFRGTIGGSQYEEFKAYTDVAPGNHYKITYSFHQGGLPGDEGAIVFSGVTVDATVTEENLTINVNPDDEILDDDDRPVNGDDDDPNPPTPPEPGSGPEIIVPDDSDIVMDAVNTVVDGNTYKLLFKSETGFTTFKVDIISDYLTDDFLTEAGLGAHLDLINPGSLEDGISGLELPVNIGGQKEVTFDISKLVPLLATGPGGMTHTFRVTVADASGTVVKDLKFKTL